MGREGRADERLSLGGELDDARSAILPVDLAGNEAARLQAVHCGGDGAARKIDLAADVVDFHGAFMEEHFQHHEI